MISFANRRNCATDIVAILENSVARLDFCEGDFVAEGNRIESLDGNGLVGLHDPSGKLLTRQRVLNHHHAHGVGFIMNNKVRCHLL